MSSANRPNRKAADAEVIKYNSLGYSLATIGQRLDCHPTSVTLRLKSLGIAPADTRRTFMEDVYKGIPDNLIEKLADQLGPHTSIKDYVRNLLMKQLISLP